MTKTILYKKLFQWSVLPLMDNVAVDEYKYEIHVYTGTDRKAGTKSNIQFIVAGTEGDTGVRTLHDGLRTTVSLIASLYIHLDVTIQL